MADSIRELQSAFLRDDYEGICERMTRTAMAQAGTAVHGTPTICERDVRRFLGMIRKGGGWRHRGEPKVVSVSIAGNRATATVAENIDLPIELPLSKDGRSWKLDSFFGISVDQVANVVAGIEQGPFPAAEGAGIEALGEDGSPCPVLDERRFPEVAGGCRIKTMFADISFDVFTAFGDFTLAECTLQYSLRVDHKGRTWTDYLQVNGQLDVDDGACGDVNECLSKSSGKWEFIPWRGRIVEDEERGFIHRMDACWQTCVGNFAGELVLRIVPQGEKWHIDATDVSVGRDGFRLKSRIVADAAGLRLRPAHR